MHDELLQRTRRGRQPQRLVRLSSNPGHHMGADEEYDKIARSDKFRPAEGKGFAGADSARGVERDKPVQFEQARPANDDEKDPFDLKEFDK